MCNPDGKNFDESRKKEVVDNFRVSNTYIEMYRLKEKLKDEPLKPEIFEKSIKLKIDSFHSLNLDHFNTEIFDLRLKSIPYEYSDGSNKYREFLHLDTENLIASEYRNGRSSNNLFYY